MFIDQAETPEQFWAALISMSMEEGYGGALIPTSYLQENLAINIAMHLSMSLVIKDGNYVFSNCKDGSLIQLTDGWPDAVAQLDIELDCSNFVFVRIHELPPGSPRFRPHPQWVSFGCNSTLRHASVNSSDLTASITPAVDKPR